MFEIAVPGLKGVMQVDLTHQAVGFINDGRPAALAVYIITPFQDLFSDFRRKRFMDIVVPGPQEVAYQIGIQFAGFNDFQFPYKTGIAIQHEQGFEEAFKDRAHLHVPFLGGIKGIGQGDG